MDNINRYQRGKIYKIISPHTEKIYIGSTTKPTLAQRLAGHTRHYKNYLAGKHNYVTSFEILQQLEYKIVLIESFPCNSRDELLACEQRHIDLAGKSCANKHKAFTGLTEREYNQQYNAQYYEENCEEIKQKTAQYRKENKDKISQWQKQKHTCPCGGQYTSVHKTHHEKSIKHQTYLRQTAINKLIELYGPEDWSNATLAEMYEIIQEH